MEQWTKESVHELIENQRAYFKTGETLDVNWRIAQLKKLKNAIINNEKELAKALYKDLGRSEAEAFLCDIGSTIMEINEIIHGLKRWARPETHFSGFLCFPSVSTKVYKMPYGVSLIISPFNFPILLTLGVLLASIAGGNTAVIKTSSKSKACTEVLKKFIAETFDEEYVALIDGGHETADLLLAERDIPVRLAVNRVSEKLFGKMHATIDDVMDTVGLPLIGIVPDDPSVTLAAAEGRPLVQYSIQGASVAASHIARRLCGRRVPLMKLHG